MIQRKQTKGRFTSKFKRETIEQIVQYQQCTVDVA